MNEEESKSVEYITLKPEDMEDFDIFLVKSLCWKCKSEIDLITYHSQVNGYDNYLGSFPHVDEILLKKYPQFLVKRISKMQEAEAISNLCKKCDIIQGNFYQRELWNNIHSSHIKPKYLEKIPVKISDILTEEELDKFNMEEKEIFDSGKN